MEPARLRAAPDGRGFRRARPRPAPATEAVGGRRPAALPRTRHRLDVRTAHRRLRPRGVERRVGSSTPPGSRVRSRVQIPHPHRGGPDRRRSPPCAARLRGATVHTKSVWSVNAAPPALGQPPGEGGEDGSVRPVQAWSRGVAAEYGHFVPQHEKFDVVGGGRATQQQEQPEYLAEDQIQQPQRHGDDHAWPSKAADHSWSAACAAFWNPTRPVGDVDLDLDLDLDLVGGIGAGV